MIINLVNGNGEAVESGLSKEFLEERRRTVVVVVVVVSSAKGRNWSLTSHALETGETRFKRQRVLESGRASDDMMLR